jgi:soluble lytic murein transglycosylase-like protein
MNSTNALSRLLRLPLLALVVSLLSLSVCAGDIYASTDGNGNTRWSTQALDGSYQKIAHLSSGSSVIGIKNTAPVKTNMQLEARRQSLHPLIESISNKYGLDTNYVMALIEVESGFQPQAVSPKGARGLMQLMPGTALRYGMRDINELHDPARNIDIGVRHLKDLLAANNNQWALVMASYNAGQNAVTRHGQRIPRYHETMLYVPAVLSAANRRASMSMEQPTFTPN